MRLRNAALLALLALVAGLPLAAAAQENGPAARGVRVVEGESGALTSSRTTSVNIEPAREAMVASQANGQVEAVFARQGEQVAAGDPVVQIDDTNLQTQVENARVAVETARVSLQAAERASGEGSTQAQVGLEAARANLEMLQTQYQQAQQLFAQGAVSRNDLEGLEVQLAQARSSFQQAQDAYSRSQRAGDEDLELQRLQLRQAQLQLEQAQSAVEDATIRAPFSGTVANLLVEVGEFIGAGSPAFRLISDEEQRARFSVPPGDAQPLIEQGLIHIPYGGLWYAAQILTSSAVPGETRLVELTASIYPSESRIPNGVVTELSYEVVLGEGIIVPSGAVRTRGGSTYVVVVENGIARERQVSIRAESGGQVALGGLEAGELVVYPLPADLFDGARVEVIGEAALR